MLGVSHFSWRIRFWHFQGDWRCIERDTADHVNRRDLEQVGRHLDSAWDCRKGFHLEVMALELPLEGMKELPQEGTEGAVGIQTRAN